MYNCGKILLIVLENISVFFFFCEDVLIFNYACVFFLIVLSVVYNILIRLIYRILSIFYLKYKFLNMVI